MHTESMQTATGRLSKIEAEEYLEGLQSLASELDRAMEAMVARELSSFESSLRLQRNTCARLSYLAKRSDARLTQQDRPEAEPLDPDLALQIKGAAESLLALNKRYSALLRHSGDTLRLFAGLFRGYHGSMQPSSGMQANLHTWSCEL